MQGWLLHSVRLAELANTYYAVVHFPATVGFLVWMFLRRPAHYFWVRRALILLTAAALVVHVVFPLAPPRMRPDLGFVDTGALFGPNVYGPPEGGSIANQFAAMPSLHIGWAVLVALGLIVATRSRWRWLWLAAPDHHDPRRRRHGQPLVARRRRRVVLLGRRAGRVGRRRPRAHQHVPAPPAGELPRADARAASGAAALR